MYSQLPIDKTKLLLVNIVDTEKVTITYPVGLYTLRSYIQNNKSLQTVVEIRDVQLDSIENIINFIKTWNPHILGFSVLTENSIVLGRFMDQLNTSLPKWPRPLIVFGRQVATFGYKELLSRYPQSICAIGEGELPLAGLCEFVQKKKSLFEINNIAFIDTESKNIIQTERNTIPGFDTIGLIDHNDAYEYKYHGGNIWMETSRGCPWDACQFCSIPNFWGKTKQRKEKSIDQIICELKQFYSMGITRITLSDEDFIGQCIDGVKRVKSIAESIIDSDIKIAFHTDMRAASIWNKNDTPDEMKLRIETLKLLKLSGLRTVFIGMESGSPSQLKRYNKGSDVETAEKAIKVCRDIGLNMAIGFIIIEPLVSKNEIMESISFINQNKILPHISAPINLLRVYPGAPYINRIRQEERKIGKILISTELHWNSLYYEIKDYMHAPVKIIADLASNYSNSQYDLFNSIRWFERYNPSIYGFNKSDTFSYFKSAVDKSKELQIDLLYKLVSLSDDELLNSKCTANIYSDAILERDQFVNDLRDIIMKEGHDVQCKDVLVQISNYLSR
jgi:radical SAM superfamily enzyme YgiQ (UPF0313 family)